MVIHFLQNTIVVQCTVSSIIIIMMPLFTNPVALLSRPLSIAHKTYVVTLFGYKTRSVALREEHGLEGFREDASKNNKT